MRDDGRACRRLTPRRACRSPLFALLRPTKIRLDMARKKQKLVSVLILVLGGQVLT